MFCRKKKNYDGNDENDNNNNDDGDDDDDDDDDDSKLNWFWTMKTLNSRIFYFWNVNLL